MMEIKVGYMVGYDYELLKHSLPTVYSVADKIVIAIEKDRKTFAGETFSIDPSFFQWLEETDVDNKINLYEDSFYVPEMGASEADTRARNLLGKRMGEGGWHFHIDVDEYFVDFKGLVAELKNIQHRFQNKKVTLQAFCSVIFKASAEGYFMVSSPEKFALITNHPVYYHHRYNADNEHYTLNHLAVHQSWGRGEDGLKTKLNNWAHRIDFDTEAYFRFWKSVCRDNYNYIKDFHPLKPSLWSKLDFVPARNIEELLSQMKAKVDEQPLQKWEKLRKWLPPVIYNRLQKAN